MIQNLEDRMIKPAVIKPADPDNAWAVNVANGITAYINKDKRFKRVGIVLSETEYRMLKSASARHKVPLATMARACAMFGVAAFVQAKCRKETTKV
jgi:hypothetical protein